MDVRGALGLDDDYRNGFERIRVAFRVKGDAPEEKLREIVARAQRRSAVFDIVTNGVPVDGRGRDGKTLDAVAGARRPALFQVSKGEHHAARAESTTEPGVRLVALAETLADDFATRAGEHDREASYPFETSTR